MFHLSRLGLCFDTERDSVIGRDVCLPDNCSGFCAGMTVCRIRSSMCVGAARAVHSFDGHVGRRDPVLGTCRDLRFIGHSAAPLLYDFYDTTSRAILAFMQSEEAQSMATYCPQSSLVYQVQLPLASYFAASFDCPQTKWPRNLP